MACSDISMLHRRRIPIGTLKYFSNPGIITILLAVSWDLICLKLKLNRFRIWHQGDWWLCPSDPQEFRGVCGARGLGECFSGKDILGLPGREVLGQRCLQKDPDEAQQDQGRRSLELAESRRPWVFFLMSQHLTDEFPPYLTVQLPYVMNELTLTELDMGFSIPKILHASAPSVDHQGRKIS